MITCSHSHSCRFCRETSQKTAGELSAYREALEENAVTICRQNGHDPFSVHHRRPMWYYSLPKNVRRYFSFCKAAKQTTEPVTV